MPRAWSRKDERKYDKIRKDRMAHGVKADRAEEIAARTVNRDGRLEGRTESSASRAAAE
jgi:hypothetical protein